MSTRFSLARTAQPEDIDELGHVNNAVYVRWIQDVAVAHWTATASADDQARWLWVVVRHEIDYRTATMPGETVTLTTWVGTARGARFDRHVSITGADGREKVAAMTSWALLDRASGRLARVPAGLIAQFQ
ncbi:MAG: acyl-CoA thioesterase [Sphingomonadales bacterium]